MSIVPPVLNHHIFICQNKRPENNPKGCCYSKGAEQLLNYMKMKVKDLSLSNIQITKSGCLNQCDHGPSLVIYPQGTWHNATTPADIDHIIQENLIIHSPEQEKI